MYILLEYIQYDNNYTDILLRFKEEDLGVL